ncbi:MAG: hypothetical protein KBD36_01645 [Alphaproteobacteria bacterium]|nr:hypothetical protein [Alphaproteobacteria bacterium]
MKRIFTLTAHHPTFLEVRKTAIFRHCAEGRSPDKAIQFLADFLDCFGAHAPRNDVLGKNVGC